MRLTVNIAPKREEESMQRAISSLRGTIHLINRIIIMRRVIIMAYQIRDAILTALFT